METLYQSTGDEALVSTAATAPLTLSQAVAAKAELARMRSALEGWLKYRAINDRAAAGKQGQALLKRPGAKASPPQVIAQRLSRERAAYEQGLATDLYALLSEVFDSQTLPNPSVSVDSEAAVRLALIAISGKLPGESTTPGAAGFIWLWPLVIVVGAIAFTISSKIRSDAEVAKEREYYQCVKEGHCTDTGFWLKVGAVGFVGWLVWDRMGVGHKVTRMMKGGRRR